MKVIFIYTNNKAPRVDVFENVSTISYTVEADGSQLIHIHYTSEQVVYEEIKNRADGQLAVFWE